MFRDSNIADDILQHWHNGAGIDGGLSRVADYVREACSLGELALYRGPEDGWLQLAHISGVSTEHNNNEVLMVPGANSGDEFVPRMRYRPERAMDGVCHTERGTMLMVPLQVGEHVVGMALATIARLASSRRALKKLRASSTALGTVLSVDHTVSDLTAQLSRAERSGDAHRTAMASSVSVKALIQVLLAQCARAIGFDAAFFAERTSTGCLPIRFAWQLPSAITDAVRNDVRRTLLDIEYIGDTALIMPVDKVVLAAQGIESILGLPVLRGETVAGIIALLATSSPRPVGAQEMATLEAFAAQVGLVLDREQQFSQFRHAYGQTMDTVVNAIELSRPELRGHHGRVRHMAVAVATQLALPRARIANLELAARYHDVGALGGANATVTAGLEFQHPQIGAEMMMPMNGGAGAARIIREHHESYDGFGFPDALTGGEISKEGQTLALAENAVERTTTTSAGQAASLQELERYIQIESGQRFAPELANAAALVVRGWIREGVGGGSCVQWKSCPQDLCGECEAASATVPCWEIAAERRRCASHGDASCASCFVWRTWGPHSGDQGRG